MGMAWRRDGEDHGRATQSVTCAVMPNRANPVRVFVPFVFEMTKQTTRIHARMSAEQFDQVIMEAMISK
jgi:hypothetical protein